MPRSCSICTHPERPVIDAALAATEPYRLVAKRFGTSAAALHRHYQAHGAGLPLGAQTRQAAPGPETSALVDTVQRLHTAAEQIHTEAMAASTIVATTITLRRVTALVLELTGVLVEFGAVSPDTADVTGSAGHDTTPAVPPLQPPDLAALPWPQWCQEAKALGAQLDFAFKSWSVPNSAQHALRQMAALLVSLTSQRPEGHGSTQDTAHTRAR